MCICINCRQIKICKTYQIIQNQHLETQIKSTSNFIPNNTLIEVNAKVSLNYYQVDWDLVECLSFIEKPGSWLAQDKKIF